MSSLLNKREFRALALFLCGLAFLCFPGNSDELSTPQRGHCSRTAHGGRRHCSRSSFSVFKGGAVDEYVAVLDPDLLRAAHAKAKISRVFATACDLVSMPRLQEASGSVVAFRPSFQPRLLPRASRGRAPPFAA